MLLYIEDKKNETHICKGGEIEKVKQKCISYIDAMCQRYDDTTYQLRKNKASKFLHIHQKVPILVSMENELLLFPTHTMSNDCVWINYSMLRDIRKDSETRTDFEFYDGHHVSVEMDYRSAIRQIRFCFMYLYQMDLHWNSDILESVK